MFPRPTFTAHRRRGPRAWSIVAMAVLLAAAGPGCTGARDRAPSDGGAAAAPEIAPVGNDSTLPSITQPLSPSDCGRIRRLGDGRAVDLRAYLAPGATDAAVAAVRATLESTPDVAAFEYVNADQAWAEFQLMSADQPAAGRAINRSAIPTSFLIVANSPEGKGRVSDALEESPDVREVLEKLIQDPAACTEVEASTD